MKISFEVPEGSGADTWGGSGRFRCRYLMKIPGEVSFRCRYLVRFLRVPVRIPGSGRFRCSYLVSFWRVPW